MAFNLVQLDLERRKNVWTIAKRFTVPAWREAKNTVEKLADSFLTGCGRVRNTFVKTA